MKSSILETIHSAQADNQAVALVTDLDGDEQGLFFRELLHADDPIQAAVAEAFRTDKSQVLEFEGQRKFVHIFNTPLRLLVVGAVHIAKPLITTAQLCDYEVTLIDPRRAFASVDRFPGVELVWEWPDTALHNLGVDSRTAVVTLTHDPKLDEPALAVALNSDAFYIGALGSRRTHSQRCERLLEAGVGPERLNSIHAPIGLDISGQSPAEIAISIVAEITQILRSRN